MTSLVRAAGELGGVLPGEGGLVLSGLGKQFVQEVEVVDAVGHAASLFLSPWNYIPSSRSQSRFRCIQFGSPFSSKPTVLFPLYLPARSLPLTGSELVMRWVFVLMVTVLMAASLSLGHLS